METHDTIMRTVCITGHRPDTFLVSHYNMDSLKYIASDTAYVLKREYGNSLEFCVGGACGADQWMGAAAIEHEIRFRLFLPFHPSIQSRYWSSEDRDELDRQMRHATGITIIDPVNSYDVAKYYERDRAMVDSANFVVAFWAGRRRGGTYETMKYALKQSKFVLNALDRMRPVFTYDLEKGWTPPHLRKTND